jgi:hypothetical protein
MKMSHRLGSSDTAGPVWGLIFGLLMQQSEWACGFMRRCRFPPSLAVAATLVGLFLAVYAGCELLSQTSVDHRSGLWMFRLSRSTRYAGARRLCRWQVCAEVETLGDFAESPSRVELGRSK